MYDLLLTRREEQNQDVQVDNVLANDHWLLYEDCHHLRQQVDEPRISKVVLFDKRIQNFSHFANSC